MKSTESNAIDALSVAEAAINVGVSLVVAYVEICAILGEDQTRMLKATVFKSAENFCQSQAVLWARLADACKTAYDRTRMVV